METEHHVDLTSAEIANLWTVYQNDTMIICVLKYALATVQDTEIRSVLEFALQLSQSHVQQLTAMFNEEQLPIPDGFNEKEDLNLQAPPLFTDAFYLTYIQNLGKIGIGTYGLALSNSARLDQCQYFTNRINEYTQLFNKATEALLSKGDFTRPPYIPKPKQVEYIQKQSYLAGWFGDRRPLNVIEISSIYFNMIQNILGKALVIGFSQVASSQEVRNYMARGKEIAAKHIEIFGSLLSEDDLPPSSQWNAEATDSTVAPFSDKLIMFHVMALNATGIGRYGASLGTSPRRDLGALYPRLMAEIAHYGEDGTNIMINNGWLEQPPQAPDRDQLAHKK
ncbi:hypothetical protein ABD68_12200 [Bacillus endophyticus]|nr:hypothetical protein [Priestia endophytica]